MKDLYATVTLISILLYLIVFVAVMRPKGKGSLKLPFFFHIGGMLLWQIMGFLVILDPDHDRAVTYYFFGMTGTFVSYAFFLPIVLALQGRRIARRGFWVTAGVSAISFALMFWARADLHVTMGAGGFYVPEATTSLLFAWGSSFILYFTGIVFLAAGLIRPKSRVDFHRTLYLLTAVSISLFGTLSNLTFLQDFPVDIVLQAFGALLTAYAVFKYRIMDIRKAYLEIALFLVLFLFLTLLFIGVRSLLFLLFQFPQPDPKILLPEILSFLFVLPVLLFLIRRFGLLPYSNYGRKSIYTERASRLAADALRIGSLKEGVSYLLRFFREAYDTKDVFIGIRNPDRKSFAINTLTGNRDKGELVETVQETHPVLAHIDTLREPLLVEGLEDSVDAAVCEGFRTTGPLREFLVSPIRSAGSLVGFVMVLTSGRRFIVDSQEFRFFTIYANTSSSLILRTEMLRVLELRVAEKELLLREIHHRVKNNMQVVSSILNLSLGKVRDDVLSQMIRDCQLRIFTMANVHEHLYRSNSFTDINLEKYLASLLRYLSSQNRTDAQINVQFSCGQASLDIDTAMYLGMIVSELASNAYKHAFRGKARGSLQVDIDLSGDSLLECRIQDDGIGMSEKGTEAESGVGTLVVRGIVEANLRGEWVTGVSAAGGVLHTIRFPLPGPS